MQRHGHWFIGRDLSRRGLLRTSAFGAAAAALSPLLSGPLSAARSGKTRRSLILLWQDGGPSHFETFDPKPSAPDEFRGELGAIQTSLPGVQFCEVLPRMARLANKVSIVRSLHQPSSGHVDGSHNVLTGWYGETDGGKSR